MALTKVIGNGVGTLASNVAVTSDDPTITMTDSSGTNDIVTLQSTSGALIITARDGSSNGEIIFKADTGSAVTEHMRINNIGAVTKPLQPAFHVHKNGSGNNVANLAINSDVKISWVAEQFDQNSDFDLTNDRFVAPITGKYFLQFHTRIEYFDTAATYYYFSIRTSNVEYAWIIDPDYFDSDSAYYSISFSVLAGMDANDTADIMFSQSAGTSQTDMDGRNSYTWFSGHLVC